MDATQQLLDLEALKRLKAMYFYTVDMRDREGWLSLFAPDGVFQWDTQVSAGGQDAGCTFTGTGSVAPATAIAVAPRNTT